MKSLKEILFQNIMESITITDISGVENYLNELELNFSEVKSGFSNGRAFDVKFNNGVILKLEFASESECFYMFIDKNKDILYESENYRIYEIEWGTLFDLDAWVKKTSDVLRRDISSLERKHNAQNNKLSKLSVYDSKYNNTKGIVDKLSKKIQRLNTTLDNLKKIGK